MRIRALLKKVCHDEDAPDVNKAIDAAFPARCCPMFDRLVNLPYLPSATLRAALSYPAKPPAFDDAAVCTALKRVDLDRLILTLDETERWDEQLSADEQHR